MIVNREHFTQSIYIIAHTSTITRYNFKDILATAGLLVGMSRNVSILLNLMGLRNTTVGWKALQMYSFRAAQSSLLLCDKYSAFAKLYLHLCLYHNKLVMVHAFKSTRPYLYMTFTLTAPKYFCINHGNQRFFIQFEIIINVLVSSFRFIWIPMLWVYSHFK